MKHASIFQMAAIGILVNLSCNKSVKEEAPPPPEVYQSTIKSCDCLDSKADGYRIEATFNGQKLCFDKNPTPDRSDPWMLVRDPFPELGMGRLNKDSTLQIGITYQNPQFHKNILPYSIDSTNAWNCEVISIDILNLKPYKFCEGCPLDDSRYFNLSSVGDLTAQIISFKDSVIEGTFKGTFLNSGSVKFPVTDGYFKTKLVPQKMDY
jgi:hypothetical protein